MGNRERGERRFVEEGVVLRDESASLWHPEVGENGYRTFWGHDEAESSTLCTNNFEANASTARTPGPNHRVQRIEVAFPSPVEPTSLPLITLNAGSKFNPPKAG